MGEEYDEKSDLWNMGVFIYYLYFKKYPYTCRSILAL